MRAPTQAELDRIEAEAASWVGTPFCANSALRGAGVCCHRLMSEVYVAAGWLPAGLEIPSGPTVWARAQERSLMEEWLDNTPFFARTEPAEAAPGDLLGFRLGCCIHHLALMLPGRRYLHAVQGHGARIVEAIPRVWQRRLAAAWRVILP